MRTILFSFLPALLFSQPSDVQMENVSIISEGTRMHGERFFAKSNAGKKLPTVVMAHGWGGVAQSLRPDAVLLAQAGYLVLSFDYRGWGQSDARMIATGPVPKHEKGAAFTAEVRDVREVVDPLDFGADWLNALHWVAGDAMCDVTRIGVWGSSFSGGLVVWAAARDARVKSLHSQVGSLDGRPLALMDGKRLYESSTKRARGESGYPGPMAVEIGKLRGAPILSRFADFAPVEDVGRAAKCAMQFVIAEKEELFDNKDHAIKAYQRHTGPKNLVSIPNITHYGIYYEARKQAQQLAIAWFDKTLK
ncbi:MAG: alpha/beta hydrolase [Candidatus Solibacter usitatus]|nr:alpha/beta hydrolase [Candidatus Solibacter usitatus]